MIDFFLFSLELEREINGIDAEELDKQLIASRLKKDVVSRN